MDRSAAPIYLYNSACKSVAKDVTPHIYVVATLLTHPAYSNLHLFGELAPSF